LTRQLEKGRDFYARRLGVKKFLAYFQSFTNTYGDPDFLCSLYKEALAFPGVAGLVIGTRPDCLNRPILEQLARLAQEKPVWLELGLQSIHPETLVRINRGHTFRDFLSALDQARAYNLPVTVHIILGLPGESADRMLQTGEALSRLPIQGLKIHPLAVLKGTGMEPLFLKHQYVPLDLETYVKVVCDILELLNPEVIIERLTQDSRPEELVAPLWTRQKALILNRIDQEMEARDAWQGKKYPSHHPLPSHP
jgi:radical SAM protein (TIGR01212 family)